MKCLLINAVKPILGLYENKDMDNNFDSRQKKNKRIKEGSSET